MKTLNKIKEKQKYSLLSLDDFEILVNFYKQEQYLNDLKEILEKEVRERPNCIEEMYEDDNYIDEKLKLQKPNPNNFKDVLKEKFYAVIFNEFKKQYEKIINDYINKNITYNQYNKKTDKLAEKTLKLLIKIKDNEKN
jgi:tRNA 2-selenouridine synthase SelU